MAKRNRINDLWIVGLVLACVALILVELAQNVLGVL